MTRRQAVWNGLGFSVVWPGGLRVVYYGTRSVLVTERPCVGQERLFVLLLLLLVHAWWKQTTPD